MKKLLLATLCILICGLAFAQAPQKMSYQAVIRDNSGNLVTNQHISMRISILKETELSSAEYPGGRTRAFGDEVTYIQNPTYNQEIYIETHTVSTNTNGLVSIEIGTGTVSMGNFSSIDWSEGVYFIRTDVDLNGGTRFKTIGTSQLISVPYAMYAQKAGSAVTETDPQFNAWDKDYNDLTNRPEIPVVPTNVSAFENDANYLTSYTETDPQFNAWDKDYNDLTNRPEIPVVPTNVSAFENDANYLTSYTETDPQFNAWDKDYNDLTNRPEIPTVPTNVSAFENDANYLISYTETDPQFNAWDKDYNDLTNRPEIPTVPTNVSAFENDANYIADEMQSLTDVLAISNSASDMQIKNVADPTENQDAVTKKYVDEIIATLQATIDSLSMVVQLGGHAFVDLGLPSGTLWANCNVGASRPEDFGDYFAWGETTTKDTYNWSNYHYCNGSNTTLTKYCYDANYGNNGFTDTLTTLQSSDDAATANWGNGWRMPTYDEINELENNCTIIQTTVNNISGWLFTGPNGNSIFLPNAGAYWGNELTNAGAHADYLTSSIYEEVPNHAWVWSSVNQLNHLTRAYGRTVRAVYNPNDIGNGTSEPLDPSQQEDYTVTFNANGGTGTMNSQTFTAGTAQSLNTNTFTQTGYNFAGWNTSANGSGTAYTNGQSVTITSDLTLYAQWEIIGAISVSSTKKVLFSQGNLQYQGSTKKWRFAEKQYTMIGRNAGNTAPSASQTGWIDLYGWGTSGYNNKYPYMTSQTDSQYDNGLDNIAGTQYDWGVRNAISNGGNQANMWRTLTYAEWTYIINTRTNASNKKALAKVNGVNGCVLLPDIWTLPSGCTFTAGVANGFSTNTYTTAQWTLMENAGAIFLPAAGCRLGTSTNTAGQYGFYWSTNDDNDSAHYFSFTDGSNDNTSARIAVGTRSGYRWRGKAVRLVKDVE